MPRRTKSPARAAASKETDYAAAPAPTPDFLFWLQLISLLAFAAGVSAIPLLELAGVSAMGDLISTPILLAVGAGVMTAPLLIRSTIKAAAGADVLASRRSVVKYRAPAPAAAVRRALDAAILAPNHFLSEPWRFRLLGPETRDRVIALADASKHDFFNAVPAPWLMVTLVPKQDDSADEKWHKLALEDHAACAAAVQNFMLSLASEGYGSKWMTGALGIPPASLLAEVGAGADEHFMGVVWMGVPAAGLRTMKAPTRKQGLAVVKQWP